MIKIQKIKMKKIKVVLGMSGGVDSSAAAILLQKKNYEVHGVFMQNWDDRDAICSAEDDFVDALSVANQLNIPLKKIDYIQKYKNRVFTQFLEDHKRGYTPNPDVLCNREIKFDVLKQHADKVGAQFIATGHYAQKIKNSDGVYQLAIPKDSQKDQTYFLYQISQSDLKKVIFPLDKYNKKEVRKIAEQNGLINSRKKDSTGICFIGERKYNDFVGQFIHSTKGNIVTTDGEIIGSHNGHIFFTIGQRKGLKIGARKGGADKPWYVVHKNINDNEIIVAQGKDNKFLLSDEASVKSLNWINTEPKSGSILYAKVRYREKSIPCKLLSRKNLLIVKFEKPCRAITPGQSIVFYNDEGFCLGGGIIDKRSVPSLNLSLR
jgi:tRNA-specific 2-thiouridylase